MNTERTQIHFLSDVLVAIASLDLKVSIFVLTDADTPRTQRRYLN